MAQAHAFLIEPVPVVRYAMTEVLRRAGVTRVECPISPAAACSADSSGVDLVVVSLAAIESAGGTAIARLRKQFRNASLVITSLDVDRRRVFELLAQGIDGFIPKTMQLDKMANAYRQVLSGQTFAPVFEHHDEPAGEAILALTHRQLEIVELMRRGLTNKEIARELSISPGTVKVHLNNVYRSIGVHNRVAALAALEGVDCVSALTEAPARERPLILAEPEVAASQAVRPIGMKV